MRSPRWVEDELLIVLDMYLDKRRVLEEYDPLVIAASELLNRLPLHEQAGQPGFRTPDAVVLRLANFRSYDPSTSAKGMSNTGRLAGEVWDRYSGDAALVRSLVDAIQNAVTGSVDLLPLVVVAGEEAVPEGRLLFRLHRRRERDPRLRARKLGQVTKEGRTPRCEVCGLMPEAVYGASCEQVLECHHLKPLSAGERSTSLDDVALLCANCHAAVHALGLLATLEELHNVLPARFIRLLHAADGEPPPSSQADAAGSIRA